MGSSSSRARRTAYGLTMLFRASVLRVRQSGSRWWIYQYKIGGKTRRPPHRRGNGDKGRTCARNSRSASRRGRTRRDPATEKKINQIQAGNVFGKLVGIRPRSYVGVKRHLKVNSKPLHVLPLEAVDQRTIAGRLNAVAEENSAVVVNRVRASLSAMFSWAMKEGLAAANPVVNTNKRQVARSRSDRCRIGNRLAGARGQPNRHTRQVADTDGPAEGRDCWLALGRDRFRPRPYLFTRRANQERQVARSADGDHSAFAVAIEAVATADLPGGRSSKNKLDAKFAAAGSLPPWRLHDLRRSVATELANLGKQPHIIEAVLNHVSASKSGVAGIYNRAIGQFGFATWSSVGARQFER